MQTLQELHAHYMAVRARLNGGRPKMVLVSSNEPEAAPEPPRPLPEPIQIEAVIEDILPVQPAFQTPQLPSAAILHEVAEKHGLTVRDMKGKSREIQFVKARQEASYRLRTEVGYSLSQIGRVLGKRDHTTILHAIKRYTKGLDQGTEPWSRQVVSERCEEGVIAAQ